MKQFDITGRVIVVTGARGMLGRQFCESLASAGVRVAALDVTPDAEMPWPGFANKILGIRADVTKKADLQAALKQITEFWTTPYGLINNAAIDSTPSSPIEENGPFEGFPEDAFDRQMGVNVKGPFLASQVFGSAMAEAGRGSIVMIDSIYGLLSPVQDIYEFRRQDGEEYYKPITYSVSKSALLNMTRYLATYWAKKGVRVNTLTLAGVDAGQDERFKAAYLERMPIGRMAEKDEYNGAVAFLMSDGARYMTGSNMVIDGGWTAW